MAAKTRPTSKPAPKARQAKQTTTTMQPSKKPPMKEMILAIVRSVQEPKTRKGISYPAIKNELKRRHGIDTSDNRQLLQIKRVLLSAIDHDELTKVSGVGVSGSFRMSAEQQKMAEQPKMAKTLVNVAKVKKTLAKKKRATKEPKTMTPKKAAPKPAAPKPAAPKPKRGPPKPRTMTPKPSKKISAKVAVTKAPPKKAPEKKATAPAKKSAPKKTEQQQEEAEESYSEIEEIHSDAESGSEHEEQTPQRSIIDDAGESFTSEREDEEEMDPLATPLPTVAGGSTYEVIVSESEDEEVGPPAVPAPKNAKSAAAEKENEAKRAKAAVVKKPSANHLKSSGQVATEGAAASKAKPGSLKSRARKASSVDDSEPASKKDQPTHASKARKASQL